MYIQKLRIKNFRSFADQEIIIDPLTAFVGRNGAGKSNVLHAIEFFYNLGMKLEAEDFHGRDTGAPAEITVTFTGFSAREREEFAPYILGDTLVVKKVTEFSDGNPVQKYYASSMQHPAFTGIRSISPKGEKTKEWNRLVESGAVANVGSKVRSADDIEPQMAAYEAGHPNELTPVESERQFFGPTNVGGGKLDNFTKFVMVPAVREAEEEVAGKRGAISQLLEMIVRRKIESRQDIIRFRTDFEERLKSLYSSENLTELPELAREITGTLNTYAPGVNLLLDWENPSLPNLPLPNAQARLEEDGFDCEIARKGHGLQRALILSLLQYLAGARPFVPIVDGVASGPQSTTPPREESPDLILAIEEPELYQHPLRSRFLCDVLCQLTRTWESGVAPRNQVLFTSHSPYFVALERFNNIRRVLKARPQGDASPIEQSLVRSFTLADAASAAATSTAATTTFTAEGFLSRARPVMNTIVNEGFFADAVLVVEGNTEYALFWALQGILQKEWYRKGIAVVPAFGKNNIDRPVIIFRGLQIPTYFVFDGDSSCREKPSRAETAARNRRYLRLAGKAPLDFPETIVERNWAVFGDKIETTIADEIGHDVYLEARRTAADAAGLASESDLLKNLDGACLFLETIYGNGLKITTLDSIVDRVDQLVEQSASRPVVSQPSPAR
jgi:putative ATP-dependent endonuclease of OLD family